jgi:hypothetical protein
MPQRIRNAAGLVACTVDYAVNFGAAEAQKRWPDYLIKNSDFVASNILADLEIF